MGWRLVVLRILCIYISTRRRERCLLGGNWGGSLPRGGKEEVPISKPTQFIVSGCCGALNEEASVDAPADLAGLGGPPMLLLDLFLSTGSPPRKSSIDRNVEEMGRGSAMVAGFGLRGVILQNELVRSIWED